MPEWRKGRLRDETSTYSALRKVTQLIGSDDSNQRVSRVPRTGARETRVYLHSSTPHIGVATGQLTAEQRRSADGRDDAERNIEPQEQGKPQMTRNHQEESSREAVKYFKTGPTMPVMAAPSV
jgi:hypothetical protein